jgi:hypothetical protein
MFFCIAMQSVAFVTIVNPAVLECLASVLERRCAACFLNEE